MALSRTGASPVIVWFRNDLRLTDNPALAAACDTGRPVIPLYILIEGGAGRPLGAASRWWLDKSLRSLAKDIVEMGGRLILRRGHAQTTLLDVVKAGGASAVYWNRRYEPGAQDEDRAIKEALGASGVEVREFNAALLSEPWDISTGSGGPYKVFSAYWRSAAPIAGRTGPLLRPRAIRVPAGCVTSEDLDAWRLHPRHPDWSGGLGAWSPGEAGAHDRLDRFLDGPVNTYAADRDRPDLEGTSRLSPHLRFGEIGPRQVWRAAQARLHERHATRRGVETFLKELGWREFNHQLLHNFPNTVCENLDPKFDAFPWRDSEADLEAWRRGRTGYPLVDAGMRQLWATGWMHNRVRMVVASFLVKDLLIDWRAGEAWFWDTLVDADLANNVGGWQWVAGSGADAAPYFRVFNPVLQAERFDPSGAYVRRWVTELARLSQPCIHRPWTADEFVLSEAGVRLGETYPTPIVDHAQARDRALRLYGTLA